MSHMEERVAWPGAIPGDLAALIMEQLPDARDLLSASHACRALYLVAQRRGVWMSLARARVSRLQGALLLGLDEHESTALDLPSSMISAGWLESGLGPWLFRGYPLDSEGVVNQLQGPDQLRPIQWTALDSPSIVAMILGPGTHLSGIKISRSGLGFKGPSCIIIRGAGAERTVLEGGNRGYQGISVFDPYDSWSSLDGRQRCVPLELGGDLSWENSDGEEEVSESIRLTVYISHLTIRGPKEQPPENRRSFGVCAIGPGMHVELNSVTVQGFKQSGVVASRGGGATLNKCIVQNNGQHGVLGPECALLMVSECTIRGNGSDCIYIAHRSIGTSRVRVSNCQLSSDRKKPAVRIRTRSRPCHLDIVIENNYIFQTSCGIYMLRKATTTASMVRTAKRMSRLQPAGTAWHVRELTCKS